MVESTNAPATGAYRPPIVVGEFILDRDTIRVWRGEKPLSLSLRQFRLMELFMQHPQRPLSRREIKQAVWGAESTIQEVRVDVEIVALRRAIGGRRREAPIRTIRSQGYVFELPRRRMATNQNLVTSDGSPS
ncbi:MAG: winged helix-turn-helix domain-containing protein [Bradyrhizobium sp.]|nr:winged helix-turn-helix domain-containing protein [Bradyrhizobium sp.]